MIDVKLDPGVNYIVSGLERSGTSMMMQILHAGGVPVGFDWMRDADMSNPKGYFELAGGKIINQLMEMTFPLDDYRGRFIKITAYGLQFLPRGRFKVIYMERNLDEVLDSMEKMAGVKDKDREITKTSFYRLNKKVKDDIQSRKNVDVLVLNYNDILDNPELYIERICTFIGCSDNNIKDMVKVIDKHLYRQRRVN